ncbi:3-hydroxybutyryl-CoA dehydrogenase [Desulfosarcina widdelii]|uniref:3-hydroxybutyryl-CoA dehydrogenase n=1 Tax=Desulfosarcina widdelii TaxID=947919 RepID=A0A5K7YS32_9BACT|nr:3-hydroxyacyl-CoA dehydrogenase family protein [Desulfosarcina widdelii]BBO72632.1 3-hydroxybutyryl-CoA dehydrogenase [Desulfosarcina widdelii]
MGKRMEIKKIFVVGAGTMGSGIAQVCAQAGLEVVLNDVSQDVLDQGFRGIAWSVGKLAEKGKLADTKETVLRRIEISTDFHATDVDLAIEAVFEDLDLKREVFKRLDTICPTSAYIATNTSTIPITKLAQVTGRPEKVIGIHFFNPVPMMDAVEVISGLNTSEETMRVGLDFVAQIGKEAIRVETDIPGFLLNRINLIGYVEAIRLLEQGIGTVEDIDKGFRLAFGRRMGPFETGDLVGLDVSYKGLMAIYQESKDIRYFPPMLLRRKVDAGQLGRKTSRGWYQYEPKG